MTQLEPSRRIGADFPLSLLAATKLVGAVGIDPRPKIGRCLIAFGRATLRENWNAQLHPNKTELPKLPNLYSSLKN